MGQDSESQCSSMRTSVYTRRKPTTIAKAGTQYWSEAIWWAQEGSSTACYSLFVSLGVGEAPILNIQSPLQKDGGRKSLAQGCSIDLEGVKRAKL